MKFRPIHLPLAIFSGLLLASGCASDEKPDGKTDSAIQKTQDDALRDPFSYGPAEHTKGAKPPSDERKRDDGTIKSDWDRFWNP